MSSLCIHYMYVSHYVYNMYYVLLVTVVNLTGMLNVLCSCACLIVIWRFLAISGGGCVPEDVSFTRIGGLSWDQWSARLALPLVAGMRVSAPSLPPAPGEPSFSCPDCGRMYKLKSSLRNHQKWECGKEPQFQCPYCVYRAKQKMHIARHMERMHREVHIKPEHYLKQDNVDACT